MDWTASTVKTALIEAFAINHLIGGRIGPKEFGSCMPDPGNDWKDVLIAEKLDEQSEEFGGTRGERFAELKKEKSIAIARRRLISPAQVSQMETILLGRGKHRAWLSGYLRDQIQPRACIEAYTMGTAVLELRGRELKENRMCKRHGWAYSTYRTRRDRAADLVAFRLNDDGIGAWIEAGPEARKTTVPMVDAFVAFLATGPKSKYQFVAYAFSNRLIPEKDIRDNAVAKAIGAAVAAGRAVKSDDGRYQRS